MNKKSELFKATITSIKRVTPKIKVFRLDYGKRDFTFKPGQWIDLSIPVPIAGKNIGGYTIISATQQMGSIDLAIRESSTHPVTQYLHNDAQMGTEVMITEGQGKFFLTEELMEDPKTIIAGGIGITPFLSMFRSLDKTINPIKIFYSVTSDEDILFRDELNPFTVFTATKETSQVWAGETTRINLEFLKKYKTDFASHFFICGPRSMIEDIVNELKTEGVPTSKIHFEKWW
jgi:ferredoxin-NADP reductase